MLDSPLAYTNVHQQMFRLLNIFVHETKSPFLATYHGPLVYTMKAIFLHFGCTLEIISLFTSESIIELSTVLFISSIWLNIAVKDIVFTAKKLEIIKLWQHLETDDFKAKQIDEFQ